MTLLRHFLTPTVTGLLLIILLFPVPARARLTEQPASDIFGGGQINLLYRVLDTHPEVGRAIGLGDDTLFLAKGTDDAVYLIRGKVVDKTIVGERFLFQNERTYRTWFQNFVPVRHFRDEAIRNTVSRGNMLPAPGTLVKLSDDPRVYVTTLGRTLRHVENETIAQKFFGAGWNRGITIFNAFNFTEYTLGPAVGSATRLTELDIPPLPTDAERFRVAGFEVAARARPDIGMTLRDLYRQILARRYLNILITWERETGSFPPSPKPDEEGQIYQVLIGALVDGGNVAALKEHLTFPGAIKYVLEKECAGTACFAFVPESMEEVCGVGAAPFRYRSNGAGFGLDFCIESAAVVTLPEVALEIHQRDMPILVRGWYRFTEAGLREL